MDKIFTIIEKKFQHIVMEGTHYEIGRFQGEILRKREEVIKPLTADKMNFEKIGFNNFEEMHAAFDEHCPGINDELQGMADVLDLDLERSPLYFYSFTFPNNCSQMAALAPVTKNNHILVGRSYEWNLEDDDFRLCTTRVKGKPAHIGFTVFMTGRLDGVNKYGLSVTFTGGGIFGRQTSSKGFVPSVTIRALLENCKSTTDAVKKIEKMPQWGFNNFLIVDKKGEGAIIECADGEMGIKRVNNDSEEKLLFQTNHYNFPETKGYNKFNVGILNQSKNRYEIIQTKLEKATPNITKETIREILSKRYPEGVCDHLYSQFFGTTWSMLFDLTSMEIEICFGAPTHNEWQSFTLDDPIGEKEYLGICPDEQVKEWPY